MAPRLPHPGPDRVIWGDFPNESLSKPHNAAGPPKENFVTPASIAPAAVDGTALASASISEDKLDTSVQAKLNAGNSPIADASSTSKGVIQLSGDLGGTAAAPTVPGLTGKADLAHVHGIAAITNLQAALDAKADQTTVTTALASKSDTGHTHSIGDTSGLQTALDGKASQSTTYTKLEVDTALAAKPDATNTYTKTEIDTSLAGKASTSHAHVVPDITNLQTSLDAKADQVALTTGLAGKANTVHTHAIADVTNLQSNLDLKADQLTTYTKSEVDTALAAKPDTTNTYTKTEVDTALSSKAAVVHTHKQTFPYSQAGTLALKTGTFRLYNDSDASWTIVGVRATVGSAPTGASIIVDVNVNGTTIFTTQGNRPSIASTEFTSGFVSSMDITSVPVGDYMTVDIDQVGSTLPGSDLCVQVMVN